MTRYALRADVDGAVRQYGTSEDPEALEPFRAGLEAALGTPVRVDELSTHPTACTTCSPPAASEGRDQ